MKYRIKETTDYTGQTVFIPQVKQWGLFWMSFYSGYLEIEMRFDTLEAAQDYLNIQDFRSTQKKTVTYHSAD